MLCLVASLFISSVNPLAYPPIPSSRVHVIRAQISFPSPQTKSVHPNTLRTPKPPPKETIAIIVQNTLYPSITPNVTQYRKDLNDSGYETILYTKPIATPQQLKGNLTLWYNTRNLRGAVLIGRLPYAQYYHPAKPPNFGAETFICDLYLMDLDGNWWDINPVDGVYDKHNASAGADIYPEIFIGRIDPQCLSWDTPANFINTYLKRIHNYRLGGVQRQHSALVYIDDDWTGYWGNRWYNDVGMAYSNRTLVDIPTTWTNGTDWLNRITQNYQWTHICVHSFPTQHWFGPGGGGSEGIVSSNPQIRNAPPSFNFYNLFACHGSQWTTTDCLGTTYAFSGSYSLGVVGSTKTGGMMDCDYFYGPLGQNKTLGESLMLWMCSALKSSAGSDYLEWYYGMNIIGDPFLTIHYDCTVLPTVISSSTHPDPSQWYANAMPQFNWTIPADVNGIVGYYYIIDQNPNTVPTPSTGTYTTVNGTKPSTPLSDGTWYIHVVAKDGAGNVGKTAAHYQVNIDTTGPATSITSPVDHYNSSSSSVTVNWTVSDLGSGYNYSQVWVDSATNIVYTGVATSTTLSGLSEGTHVVNVTTFDLIGNSGSHQITICVDLTNPTVSITAPANGTSTTSTSIQLTWSVSDAHSGYHYAEIRVDGSLEATVQAPNTSLVVSGLSVGSHTLNVTVYDWAGHHASDQVSINIQSTTTTTGTTTTPPPIPGFPWEGLVLGLAAAFMAVLSMRKRLHRHQ